MTPLDIDRRCDTCAWRQRTSDSRGLSRTFGIAVAVVSLVGTIFAAGYNWRSISNVEAAQNDFVRKDVQGQQLRNVDDRLSEISRQFEELRREIRSDRTPHKDPRE